MSPPVLQIRVLGPASISRSGVPVPLPRSRKVRALLAFMALDSHSLSRSRLCDLLWDVPNDPRGELRWCLSKLRSLLDDNDRQRIVTTDDTVSLDLGDCRVDAIDVDAILRPGVAQVSQAQLEEVAALFGGDLLDAVSIDGSPELTGWLSAQRHRHRALHVAVVAELAA